MTLSVVCLAITIHAQDTSQLFEKLANLEDQYGNHLDYSMDAIVTFIFVEGNNNTFMDIYSKFKGKNLKPNAFVISGWKNVMPGVNSKSKREHMFMAMKADQGLGKDGYPIFLDMDSNTHQILNLKQYSVIKFNPKAHKLSIKSYGSDRAGFIRAIRQYFI